MNTGRIVVTVFLLVLVFSLATVLYWLYGPDQVLKINNGPVPVHPTTQKADELVFLTVDYCKQQSVKGTVRRYLVSDTIRIPLPLQTDSGSKGCQHADVPLLIPKGVIHDIYYVHIDVIYQLNPVRQVTNSLDSQHFIVQ
jgi:hypothetical protein